MWASAQPTKVPVILGDMENNFNKLFIEGCPGLQMKIKFCFECRVLG